MKKLYLAMVLMLFALSVGAVPAKPGQWRTLTLQGGQTVRATLVGDEFGHFFRATDGKAYRQVGATGRYAEINLQEAVKNASARRSQMNKARSKRLSPAKIGSYGDYTGAKKCLIILAQTSDVNFQTANNKAYYERVANEVGFSDGDFYGSMYDYFYAQSRGIFQLTFDVVGPYTVSQKMSYYGGNDSSDNDQNPAALVREAIVKAQSDVNYANYDWDGDGYVDQVYVIYAGKGEADGGADDTIWPHAWDLNSAGVGTVTANGVKINNYACGGELDGQTGNIAGIGTMCHEFSHCLGFPDFYDTDYSGGWGMDEWDLMCSGSYNGDGYRPCGYTSWERWMAGWQTPITLSTTTAVSGMKPLEDNGESYIIYNSGNSNEYFMLENRGNVGWDAPLSGHGMLIVHVDYNQSIWDNNKPNDDASHQRMTWVPADNQLQYETTSSGYKYLTAAGLATDPFPTSSNNTFGPESTPKATWFNNNANGNAWMEETIENITKDANGYISFNFRGLSNVATPTFSPTPGRYSEAQNVTISCETSGTTIYYTTDGTTPTTSSTQYTSPINIAETTTIKAIAYDGTEESAVATATYKIGAVSSDPNTKKFKRVSSVNDLEDGLRYVIACGSKSTAAGALSSSLLSSVSVTVNSDIVTINDNVAVFVLEGDQTNGWTFKNESTNQYLYSTAAKSVKYSSDANTWTLSDGTDGVIMTYGDYGTMLYNANNPRFTTYTSTPNASMIQANLYMEDSTPASPAIATEETLTFSTTVGTPQTLPLEVLSEGLTENITLTLTDASGVFSLSANSISKTEEDATINVTFTPTAAGNYTGSITLQSAGAETVTVQLTATATEAGSSTGSGNEFALVTKAANFGEGDYIIVYNNGAMNTTVTSSRLQITAVTPTNDIITTDDETIIWHIAPSGDYYTIYNAAEDKYAASTGAKNKAQLLADGTNDMALWSVSTGATFEFTNKKNNASSVNDRLRRNGDYGFACYASSTGGELSLYKRTSSTKTTPTMTFSPATVEITIGDDVTEPTLTTDPAGLSVTYSSSDTDVATVNSSTGEVTVVAAGTTTITATFAGNDDYNSATATYTLTVNALPQVETPTFTPAAGTYTEAQNVTISCATSGATVYYTVDGTTPTTSSSVYSSAIAVTETTTIKAIAVKSGMTDSEVAEALYTISNDIDSDKLLFKKVTTVTPGKRYLIVYNINDALKLQNPYSGTKTYGYLYAKTDATDNNGIIEVSNETDIFTFETATDGFYIKDSQGRYHYQSGSYNNFNLSTSVPSSGGVWTATADANGLFTIMNSSTNKWMQYSTTYSSTGAYSSAQSGGILPYLYEEVEAVEVTVQTPQYGTLYYGTSALEVPANVTAYAYYIDDNGDMKRGHTWTAGDVIPAGTGVVVAATADTYEFIKTSAAGTEPEQNMLRGSDVATQTTGGAKYYKLSLNAAQETGTIGFYFGADEGGAFTNGAHKAYLAVPAELANKVNIQGYPFAGGTTAIDGITIGENKLQNAVVFDLQGRRVDSNGQLPKGIYIVNGKKFIVK